MDQLINLPWRLLSLGEQLDRSGMSQRRRTKYGIDVLVALDTVQCHMNSP
ncbi:hypothetical protein [Streptomyces thermolilacinus]